MADPLRCIVIDTNVLAVAEGLHPGASEACRAACIDLVRQVEKGLVVAVDSGDQIVSEYLGALRGAGRSGLGAKLATRLFRLRRSAAVCRLVDITPIDEPEGSYDEVPDPLRDFDIDDHKFIAVAVADEARPQIHTAVDGEWWDRRRDFVNCGVDVQYPCAVYLMDRDLDET
jgi:hypothetical protein